MNLYQEHILDHYKNPRNVGEIEGALSARELNPLCGDEITVYVKSKIQNPKSETNSKFKIIKIKYSAKGCAISVASASIFSEKLIGKTANEVAGLTENEITDILGIELTPARVKCAMLPIWAIKKTIDGNSQNI